MIRNIKRLVRKEVYQVYGLKSTGKQGSKVTCNEESKVVSPAVNSLDRVEVPESSLSWLSA